jgi:hypothetical protein
MGEIKLNVTGWKAIAVLILVGAVVGYRYYAMRTTLATEAAAELKFWLAAEYQAQGLPALREALDAGDRAVAEQAAAEVLARDRVTFRSVKARGRSDDVIVRAEILVDGAAPPTGKSVRYFRMRYSTVTGWRMERETTALSYFLKLL